MPPTPTCLAHFTEEELSAKVHALLEDWSSPTLSPIGLCRAHDLSLAQIIAISQLPMFTAALEDIRTIESMRQEHTERKAHRLAFDRLCYLVNQIPTSAAFSKEIRLAAKMIFEIITKKHPHPKTQTPKSKPRCVSTRSPRRIDQSPPSPAPGGRGQGEGSPFYPPPLLPLLFSPPPRPPRDLRELRVQKYSSPPLSRPRRERAG